MDLVSGAARPFQWNMDAVRRLAEDAAWALTSNPTGVAEVAGLLLGKVGSSVEILDCQPVCLMREQDHGFALAGPGRREFERAIAWFRSIPESELSVVGFYRSDLGGQLLLTQEDLGLIRTCFRDTSQVTLLLNVTRDQLYSATLFSGDNGHILYHFHSSENATRLPGWLDLWQNLTAADPVETSGTQGPASAETIAPAEPAPLPDPPFWEPEEVQEARVESERRSRRILLLVLAAAALLAALVGYPMFKQLAKQKQQDDISAPSVAVQSDSSINSGLALRADKLGDDLQVDWNRGIPIIAAASGGILTIREGNEREKQVMLDANVLKNGSVVYRPVDNDDVFLRLVIFKQGGATLGESDTTYPSPKPATR